MAKNVILTNENRKAVEQYLAKSAQLKALEKEVKELKAQLETTFGENNECIVTNGITEFTLSTIQRAGKPVYVVYERTTARGTIDYKTAYESIGGTEEYAELFRKPDSIRTTIKEVTEKMLAKYRALMGE